MPLPPLISAYEEGSFACFTIRERLPKILADVTEQFDPRDRRDPRWESLRLGIATGGAIDLQLFSGDTPYWQRKLAGLPETTWAEQSFFDLEFLFYLAIDSIARDLRPGFDVFAAARRSALVDALPNVASVVESSAAIGLDEALRLALASNEADLSQLTCAGMSSMLHDERPGILARLSSADGAGVVQLLADNAGSELCFDLVLVDALLRARPGAVELQLKPRPMFVSDAMIRDVEESIAGFERLATTSKLAQLGERLRRAQRDGRLLLRAPLDWAEPRHMNALEAEPGASLRAASVVLAKGDLNYRRFFEDRAWPAESPVALASVASGMVAFALRVLKSDSIVGLEAAQVSQLFAAEPDWRSNGKYSIVQRIDQGASSSEVY